MLDSDFIINAIRAKQVNKLYLREKVNLGHIVLLTEIVKRKIENKPLPNVKWLQTELEISTTKIKSICSELENRGFITKSLDVNDRRVKKIDITPSGKEFIYRITSGLTK
ncbi:MAG: hypothetical protein CBE02_03045 [Gammaproteobacteria bacterium TMED242]|uniref:HTH marR-type domain-containing protein n=1 Tax=SAR86 cluster bacterium TaxID=2030880 RepID=A0A520MGR4_9GAMM|nr:MAG: hypothetical protein CBE02_03045 [Gammaproteobacteria bacterium TMED242]RZO20377.1 MAG: hypothetical protein EVA96_02905 [SAR86 cluster bacterium]|tara:strand:+ start:525 stop:854 length:330 start_codon:yes stop_codon:yes gene_type:complete